MAEEELSVRCCIAGGGPAGMMLGFLLARGGIDVLVLEKHADFLRDFRGDTLHPSTLEVLHELGLVDELLRLPHQKARTLTAFVGNTPIPFADFTHLPVHHPFVALMPQWDFLDFIAGQSRRYPGFKLRMQAEATDLLIDRDRIAGLVARTPEGELRVRADLVIGADGRHSHLRDRAGLHLRNLGAPMDVLWFRLSRSTADPDETMGRFEPGAIFVSIDRGDYWQCGFVIRKGSFDDIKGRGLAAFRETVARLAPYARERVVELDSWDKIKLLTVSVDRLDRWYRAGFLCIGDAAHAMSPIGGVGINLAIQDAVAAANLLYAPLQRDQVSESDLARVQKRRELPARLTQSIQVAIQDRVIARLLGGTSAADPTPPLLLRLMKRIPFLRRIPARAVGMGLRPEHVSAALRG